MNSPDDLLIQRVLRRVDTRIRGNTDYVFLISKLENGRTLDKSHPRL